MAKASKSIKLPRKTTSVLIVDSMRERLMNHEFDESEMIRQDRLAKEYNVSLSPVREALIQLEAAGLLTLVRHHGYAITALSIDASSSSTSCVRSSRSNCKEHTELLDYCEARETHKAAQLLRNHILEAGDDLIGFLQQNRPPPK